ncbi:MAG: hypothetical protein M1281_04055 [Chloroflexi bacterium]|nr:hypothetical protein [Chloroflexota bacterium]
MRSPAGTRPNWRENRPGFWVRLLAVGFLFLALMGWLRFQQALESWNLLSQLGAWPGPLYIAAGGAAWGLVGLPPAWGLWTGRDWGPLAALLAGLFFPLTYWIDRLIAQQVSQSFTNWPFALGVTAAWMIFIFVVLARRWTRR